PSLRPRYHMTALLSHFFSLLPPLPSSPLLPYTTLFRSHAANALSLYADVEGVAAVLEQVVRNDAEDLDVRHNALWRTSRSSASRSEEHTSELQSREKLVCRLLLEKKKKNAIPHSCLSSS